jgi:hypothetical protein
MAAKTKRKNHQAALLSIVTTEEASALSPQERADLIDSLEAAETHIDAGDFVEYDPEIFEDRLLDAPRNVLR